MNMKKIFMMVVAAMFVSSSMNAQNGYDDTKHEVAISYGGLSTSQWVDIFETIGGLMVGMNLENEVVTGPISAEYFYHTKNWLVIGGIFVFGQSKQDVYSSITDSYFGSYTNTYLTLMPAVKMDWLRRKHFGMYSKVALGATLRTESTDYDDEHKEDEMKSESNVHFNCQVSLLGIEAGTTRLRAFAELGFGEQGTGLVGLRYKF
jgi:hypothetical protein